MIFLSFYSRVGIKTMIPQKEKTKLLFRCFNFDINLFHISVLILGFSGFRGGGGWGGFGGGLGWFSLGGAGDLHGGQVLDGFSVALLDFFQLHLNKNILDSNIQVFSVNTSNKQFVCGDTRYDFL